MTTIDTGKQLKGFRGGHLTGRHGIALVRQHGQVLAQLPVGVGKSWWLDEITYEAIRTNSHDLVIVLSPTRRLIEERRPLKNPPSNTKVINLRPRPEQKCGPQRNEQWKKFEAADLGALGRREICDSCPNRGGCFWPRQYGQGLKGARIIYATQAHLERSPIFVRQLADWVGCDSYLVLMDESNFIAKPMDRTISHGDLSCFSKVLKSMPSVAFGRQHTRWTYLVDCLTQASTNDLQSGNWMMPRIDPDWAYETQKRGWLKYGDTFRFPGWDLAKFSLSNPASRRRDANGNVQYSVCPRLGKDSIVFSGTTNARFAEFRYGQRMASPFSDYRFFHPGTQWFNIASKLGMRQYFPGNAEQIFGFFAQLIADRLRNGKRPLFVCKKMFIARCIEQMTPLLRAQGYPAIKMVGPDMSGVDLSDPNVIPVIHYGVIGVNLFENFDAAYCLTGYYVNERVVNQCLQDTIREDLRLDIEIRTDGSPRRRIASAANPQDRFYDVHGNAPLALENQELEPVVQAVGRVRPFTKPREIITFQCGQLPGVQYTREFKSLAEARTYFGIPTARQWQQCNHAQQCAQLRAQGMTQEETAKAVGISERTVRRYEEAAC